MAKHKPQGRNYREKGRKGDCKTRGSGAFEDEARGGSTAAEAVEQRAISRKE